MFIVGSMAILGLAGEDDPRPKAEDWVSLLVGLALLTTVPIGFGAFLVLRKGYSKWKDVV